MKTYSRKSSKYLKKAFIASNFNEMCRLCLSEVDMVLTPIFQDSQISYQEWIQYSVDILVEEGDGMPSNICEECLGMIERMYIFKKKCKASDSKLREHLQLVNSNEFNLSNPQIEIQNNVPKTLSNQDASNVTDVETVDPGGFFPPKEEGLLETEESTKETEEITKQDNIKNSKSNPLGAMDKDVVKSINEENIIINEIKRYVCKNESTSDKNFTVCEVVHYDIRKEGEDSSDGFSNDVKLIDKTYTTTDLLEEYSNHLKSPVVIDSSLSTDGKSDIFEQQEFGCVENVEGTVRSEGKIQEICQLWDNDDEDGELLKQDEELDEEDIEDEEEAKEVGGEDEEEGLVVDVSWEDRESQKFYGNRSGVVEVKLEENGVVKTHKVFTSENSIQLIKCDTEQKEYNCTKCNKYFSSYRAMQSHITSYHKEMSHTFCSICVKNFTSPNSLKRHMLVHTGVKPYNCETCGRKFSQSSILKRHKYTHVKRKPFECNFCQKSYTQKMNLVTHLRNHGIKTETVSHRCKLCHKSFVHPSGLSRHLKYHKGVRFTCSQCNKCFSDSSALARHVKSTHC